MSDDGIKRELGISRRQLVKRGAVVGGTLLWAAPVIQSMTTPAFAHHLTPRQRTCCSCKEPGPRGNLCSQDNMTPEECAAECGGADNVKQYAVNHTCDANNECAPLPQ